MVIRFEPVRADRPGSGPEDDNPGDIGPENSSHGNTMPEACGPEACGPEVSAPEIQALGHGSLSQKHEQAHEQTHEQTKTLFLQEIAAGRGVRQAAEAAGVSFETPHHWRETDKTFAANWRIAEDAIADVIEEEAFRRAVKGVEKPVYRSGEVVGHVSDYSDAMLMFLLKARKPERYGTRQADTADDDANDLAKRLNLKGARDALVSKFRAVTESSKTQRIPE